MKFVLLILSLLLSWFSGDGSGAVEEENLYGSETVVQAQAGDRSRDYTEYNTICLCSARGARFSSEDNTFSPAPRTTNAGKRTNQTVKSSTRIVKSGKVIDRQNSNRYMASILENPSGMRTVHRYIYSICTLLI